MEPPDSGTSWTRCAESGGTGRARKVGGTGAPFAGAFTVVPLAAVRESPDLTLPVIPTRKAVEREHSMSSPRRSDSFSARAAARRLPTLAHPWGERSGL
jgi:hypothetical protein